MESSQTKSLSFDQSIKIPLIVVALGIVTWGAYNSARMNSTSFMQESPITSFKRIDELNGNRVEGRAVAHFGKWTAVAPAKIVSKPVVVPVPEKEVSAVVESKGGELLVDGRLEMPLVEVFNPQKYATNISGHDFSGSVNINNDTIESMEIRVKNGKGQFDEINLSYVQILGKTSFEYEIDSEKYSGIIFQSQDDTFVVSLVNGPHAGTRLKFGKEELKKFDQVPPVSANPTEAVAAGGEQNIDGVSFKF